MCPIGIWKAAHVSDSVSIQGERHDTGVFDNYAAHSTGKPSSRIEIDLLTHSGSAHFLNRNTRLSVQLSREGCVCGSAGGGGGDLLDVDTPGPHVGGDEHPRRT